MKNLLALIFFVFSVCQTANADVWKWVDAKGKTHFVDTIKPIYTWVDDDGKSHYSDMPEHANAVSVQIVWHSQGDLSDVEDNETEKKAARYTDPNETDEDRAAREGAEAYYCKKATQLVATYLKAPRLFKAGASGKPEYLSEKDAAATIEDTKAKQKEYCR
jgi:hypothetical protein